MDYPTYRMAKENNYWAWFKRLASLKPHLVLFNYHRDGTRDAQLRRWWIIPRNKYFNIYLHQILSSDDDRALHDHPWHSVSFLLKGMLGEVIEAVPGDPEYGNAIRYPTRWVPYHRPPKMAHRLIVDGGEPCWTLFITGPKVRLWGFLCDDGWKSHAQFRNDGGCGES